MPVFDAVFFDIGSTLIPSAKIIRSAAGTACRRLARAGLIPNARDFHRNYVLADAQCHTPHLSHIYSDRRIIQQAERWTGLPEDLRRVAFFLSAYREALRAQIKPSKKIIRLFETLQSTGVHRGIISDGSVEGQGEVLAQLGLLPFVSPGLLFISEAVGCTKENPEIYRQAAAAVGVPAERILMVGDRIDLDVAVPQSLGMKAVLWQAYAAPSFVPAGLRALHAEVKPEQVFDSWEKLERWLRGKTL